MTQMQWMIYSLLERVPWLVHGKAFACKYGRRRFDPWVRKIPWRKKWQPLQYSCLGNPITEEPSRIQSMGSQSVGYSWAHTHSHIKMYNYHICYKERCLKQNPLKDWAPVREVPEPASYSLLTPWAMPSRKSKILSWAWIVNTGKLDNMDHKVL